MKLIFCIQGIFNSGGMERVLINRVNYLYSNYGYEILIITTDQKNRESFYKTEEGIEIKDLEINYLDNKKEKFFKRIYLYLKNQKKHKKRLQKIVNEYAPDFIIAMGDEERFIVPKLKTKAKKILEHHLEKNAIFREKRSILYRIKDIIFSKKEEKLVNEYDEFLVLTNEDKKQWNNSKIKVINNPLPFYFEKFSNCEQKKIISVGRLMPQKGYDILIDVWNVISKKYPDWILEIYGEGSERKNLQNKINKLGLEKSFLLKGTVKNIQDKYLESSIYVMSSRYEGFGMVLVEAMSCGLPVISFDCPCGPKDIIKDNEDGFIIKFGNINQMVERIEELILDEEKRKLFGKNARKNIQRFSEDEIMKKWKNLFEN